jgi:hypothetical protein
MTGDLSPYLAFFGLPFQGVGLETTGGPRASALGWVWVEAFSLGTAKGNPSWEAKVMTGDLSLYRCLLESEGYDLFPNTLFQGVRLRNARRTAP